MIIITFICNNNDMFKHYKIPHKMNVSIIVFLYIISCIIIGFYTAPHTLPITPKKKKCRVVCSLTTRPSQPYYFGKVLDRLVKQFDAVYLTLPYTSHKGVKYPEINHPGVIISRPEKDYGPITKFFGALDYETDPDTLIVVVDDDIIYNPKLRSQFMKEHLRYPDCILTGAGIVYKYDFLPWYLSMTGRPNNNTTIIPSFAGSNHTTTVAGTSGVAFTRDNINKEELLKFVDKWCKNKLCFDNDDIVISAYFSSKGIKRLYANVDNVKAPTDKDTESLSIGKNIFKTQNDAYICMKNCFKDPFRYDCFCMADVMSIIIIFFILRFHRQNLDKGHQEQIFETAV